jgi:hypothetical protein
VEAVRTEDSWAWGEKGHGLGGAGGEGAGIIEAAALNIVVIFCSSVFSEKGYSNFLSLSLPDLVILMS